MLVAADWDVKQQIIKLFVWIQHVSYLPFMPTCNEMDWTSPHQLLGGICHAYSNFNRTLCLANCGDPDQTANHDVASNLDQHCLSIYQNKGGLTRPIQALLPLDKSL